MLWFAAGFLFVPFLVSAYQSIGRDFPDWLHCNCRWLERHDIEIGLAFFWNNTEATCYPKAKDGSRSCEITFYSPYSVKPAYTLASIVQWSLQGTQKRYIGAFWKIGVLGKNGVEKPVFQQVSGQID